MFAHRPTPRRRDHGGPDRFRGCPDQEAPLVARLIPFPTTLKDVERSAILRALEDRDWVVGGLESAAAKLGVKRTTLISKMKLFGICRPVTSDVAL